MRVNPVPELPCPPDCLRGTCPDATSAQYLCDYLWKLHNALSRLWFDIYNDLAYRSFYLYPASSTIAAGETQTYTVEGYIGTTQMSIAIGDVTFSIESGAGGSWDGAVYTSENEGTWTVTATYQGLTDTSTLTVSAAGY